MKKERFAYILRVLDRKNVVYVSQLARELGVSEMTIRTDLGELAEQNLLVRIHGGAKKCGEHLYKENVQMSIYKNSAAKQAIAKAARRMIKSGDTVLLDDSSTCLYLAREIADHTSAKITVYTNSVLAAKELLDAQTVSLHLIGGEVSPNLAAAWGKAAVRQLEEIGSASLCFLGANGISAKEGISVIGYPQMYVKQAMIRISKQSVVLADSTKFGQIYASTVAQIQDVDAILTNKDTGTEDMREIKKAGKLLTAASGGEERAPEIGGGE